MTTRTFVSALAKTALAAVLLCTTAAFPRAGTAAPTPYTLDAILSLTGGGSFLGHDMSQSLAALADLVNRTGGIDGHPLKFDIHDDGTNPQVTVQLFNTIAERHPAAIIGPAIAATCGAIAPLVKDVVVYCLSPSARPARDSYLFSSSTATTDQFVAMLRYLSERGYAKVATLTSTDATGQDADRGIGEALAKVGGVEIVDKEHFAPTDLSVAAQIARVKASPAQLLVAWSTGTPFGTILHAVADAGLKLPVLSTAGNMSLVQLKQYAGIVPSDLMFTGVEGLAPDTTTDKATKDAIALFDRELAKQGMPLPGFVHQTVWDPGLMIVAALRKYGVNATAAQVHDYIEGLRGWTGINGPYDFAAYPQRGLGINAVVIARWNAQTERWQAVSKGGGAPVGR